MILKTQLIYVKRKIRYKIYYKTFLMNIIVCDQFVFKITVKRNFRNDIDDTIRP